MTLPQPKQGPSHVLVVNPNKRERERERQSLRQVGKGVYLEEFLLRACFGILTLPRQRRARKELRRGSRQYPPPPNVASAVLYLGYSRRTQLGVSEDPSCCPYLNSVLPSPSCPSAFPPFWLQGMPKPPPPRPPRCPRAAPFIAALSWLLTCLKAPMHA